MTLKLDWQHALLVVAPFILGGVQVWHTISPLSYAVAIHYASIGVGISTSLLSLLKGSPLVLPPEVLTAKAEPKA